MPETKESLKVWFQGVLGLLYFIMIFVTYWWFPLAMPVSKTYGDVMVKFGIEAMLSILWPLAWLFKLMDTPL